MHDVRRNAGSEAEIRTVAEGKAADAKPPWLRRWALKGARATAAAFALAGYTLVSCVSSPADEPNAGISRGSAAVAVVKPTTAAAFDRTFAWQRVETATSYQVVLFSDAGDRVFELRDLKLPSVKIAESVTLTPGRYSWQVAAFQDGKQLAESERTEFVVP